MKINKVEVIELTAQSIKKMAAINLHFRFRQNMNKIRNHYGF